MVDEQRVSIPNRSYRLDPVIKARLQVAFDANALEDILATYPDPADRDKALQEFLELADRSARGEIVITDLHAVGGSPEVNRAVASIRQKLQDTRNHHAPSSNAESDTGSQHQ